MELVRKPHVVYFYPLFANLCGVFAHLRRCEETDYYYQYTECDGAGSRWRVAIPVTAGQCWGLPDPVPGTRCSFSCGAGEFLEMSTQQCAPCAPGSYSLGSALRFDQWDEIPAGFRSLNASHTDPSACDGAVWVARGSYVESNRDECSALLLYTVNLKKPGAVSFQYQHVDTSLLFQFTIQNEQCQEAESDPSRRWIKRSAHGEWGTHRVTLNSGSNVLCWRTTRLTLTTKPAKPVLLKNVLIEGVAYTSECFPCKPGTFSHTPGSSSCEPCPRDTYSGGGASSCSPCHTETHYASEGSSTCRERPACTQKDYTQSYTTCDASGKTRALYKWVEPRVCLEAVPGAVTLPPSGQLKPCPPCNPGFHSQRATCSPCPPGTFSDGVKACQPCPTGTEPVVGLEYKWWDVLPANMETSCFNVANNDCDGLSGWEVGGDHVHSAAGRADNDYLILTLKIPGFQLPVSERGTSGNEFGRITFVFETRCSADCEFYFMTEVSGRSSDVVESWGGSQTQQSYSHVLSGNSSVVFTWAFQRSRRASELRRYAGDAARIFSLLVVNALEGVASSCRACALRSRVPGSSCAACPAGHFIDQESGRCEECPAHSIPAGGRGCRPCGPGSRSDRAHGVCSSDCTFSHTQGDHTLQYNFSALASVSSITSGPSFTAKGTEYYHLFHLSLCGAEGAVCRDNVSESEGGPPSSALKAFICRSTIIPSEGRSLRTALSSQSFSVADTFQGATLEKSLDGIIVRAELFPSPAQTSPDLHFFYRSAQVTASCPRGRSAVVSLRCNPEGSVTGDVSVPSKCPAGTCDGCTFHFLWESANACPSCTDHDYRVMEGACKAGMQETVYMWIEPRRCNGGVSLPLRKTSPCEEVGFWLKVCAGLGTSLALLLVSLTCHFWKKNKRLEYTYSKLLSANKVCELPGPDSCAIMEGEVEGNEEEDVVYVQKSSLLARLKALVFTGNGKSDGSELKLSRAQESVWG